MQKEFGLIFTVVFSIMIISSPAFAQSNEIPNWIKTNAGWWADGSVDNSSFVSGIEFLMQDGLLKTNTIPNEFPAYLKTESKNWSDGTINDQEYLLIIDSWIESYNPKSSINSSNVELSDTFQNQIKTNNDIEIGLEVGQWIKYSISVKADGDDSLKNYLETEKQTMINDLSKNSGFDIDKAIWIKYTVADISGTVITFDRTVKLATTPEIKNEFKTQSFLKILDSKNKIDPDILANVSEKKLKSKETDLTEFHPVTSFAMPINLEFGSKFDSNVGEVTFLSIEDDPFNPGVKENRFAAHKIITQTVRNGVIENDIEFDVIADSWYDKQSGILDARELDIQVTNKNTYESGWITQTVSAIERSNDLKSNETVKPINDRNEILERLSYLFVATDDSRYLITNAVDSIGEPKKTTFDIINTRDGSELGALILYGNDKISSVRSSTVWTGAQEIDTADDIHIMIRQSLVPDCCGGLPTHSTMFWDNPDGEHGEEQVTIDDVKVEIAWAETEPTYNIGIFSQEITFPDTKISQQDSVNLNNIPMQLGDFSEPQDSEVKRDSTEQDNDPRLLDGYSEIEEPIDYGIIGIGLFIFIGIPVIIIALVIWKIKRWKSKRNSSN